MEARSDHGRDLRRIVLAALAVGTLVVGGTAALIGWTTSAVDRIAVTKERALVERRLTRTLDGLVDDLNSATVWDDTVVALSGTPDLEWLQANLGEYYADYKNHEITLTYDSTGRLLAASRDSEAVALSQEAPFAAAVARMVAEVRAEAATPAKRQALGLEAVVNRKSVLQVGGETWLVAASTVVPELATVTRPAADPVVVSAQPISVLLASIRDDLGVLEPRLSTTVAEGPANLPLTGDRGQSLGALTWVPARPGRGLLLDSAGIIAGVLLALLAASVVLWRAVNRVDRRLADKEAALTDARDRAEAANIAKSRFLANMSHELRTPLNGVVGMAEVMAFGELSPIQRSRLDVLRESSGNLLELIERLLQVSRLERKEVLVARAAFDPVASVEEVVAEHRSAAAAKGLELTIDCCPTGPRMGDETHVKQVLDFLIDNAVTYTDEGRIEVVVSQRDGAVRFVVSDTGIGIDPGLLPQLFDIFVQGDDSMTRRFEGAGIGLSICRNLVDAMGGRISVASEPGRGSAFTVDLPLPAATTQADCRLAA